MCMDRFTQEKFSLDKFITNRPFLVIFSEQTLNFRVCSEKVVSVILRVPSEIAKGYINLSRYFLEANIYINTFHAFIYHTYNHARIVNGFF